MAKLKLSESTNKQVIDEINNSGKLAEANKFTNTNEIEVDVNDANTNSAFFRVSAKNNTNTEAILNVAPRTKSVTRSAIDLTAADAEVATTKYAKDLANATIIRRDGKPTADLNPQVDNAIYIDTKTGILYVCSDKTAGKNVWVAENDIAGVTPAPAEPGAMGFGAGIAPQEYVTKWNLTTMDGTLDPNSPNYGNYKDNRGSIMVWIPKIYMRTSHNPNKPYWGCKIEFSYTKQDGFWLHRCFYNNGKEIDGFFVDKYLNSNNGGVLGSIRSAAPLSSSNANNGINNLPGIPDHLPLGLNNSNKGNETARKELVSSFFYAAKIRGTQYSPLNIFQYNFLVLVSRYVYQKAYETDDYTKCHFASKTGKYNFTKGMNVQQTFNAGIDDTINYGTPTYTHSNGSKCYRTGNVSDANLGKISHNGLPNGVIDLIGSLWHWCPGYFNQTLNNVTNDYILKDTVNYNDITFDNMLNLDFYDKLNIPAYWNTWRNANAQGGPLLYFNGSQSCFRNSADKNSNDYKLDACGIPNDAQLSTTVDENLRQTYIYRAYKNPPYASMGLCGSSFGHSCFASVHLDGGSGHVNFGGRCSLLPE